MIYLDYVFFLLVHIPCQVSYIGLVCTCYGSERNGSLEVDSLIGPLNRRSSDYRGLGPRFLVLFSPLTVNTTQPVSLMGETTNGSDS